MLLSLAEIYRHRVKSSPGLEQLLFAKTPEFIHSSVSFIVKFISAAGQAKPVLPDIWLGAARQRGGEGGKPEAALPGSHNQRTFKWAKDMNMKRRQHRKTDDALIALSSLLSANFCHWTR